MDSQLQPFGGRGPNGMKQLFNITEHFSKSLDEIRGPNRKKNFLKQAQSWIKPSPARRAATQMIGYGSIGLLVGGIGLTLFRRRRELVNINSNIKSLFGTKTQDRELKAG